MALVSSLWHVPQENLYGNKVFEQKQAGAGFKNITVENVGELTVPGYYRESRSAAAVRAVGKVRGFLRGVIGCWLIGVAVGRP